MNLFLESSRVIVGTILMLAVVSAFIGILFLSIYNLQHFKIISKYRKIKTVRYTPKNIVDLYRQFEMLVHTQVMVGMATLRIRKFNQSKSVMAASKLKNKPLKTINLSGSIYRPFGAISLFLVLVVISVQIFSIYSAASLQGSTLLVIGWAVMTVWLIISALLSDFSLNNKLMLSLFSPLTYFLLLIRFIVSTLLCTTKTKIAI
jgi:hypothetical protein